MKAIDLNLASTPFRNNTPYYLGYGVGALVLALFTVWNGWAFFAYAKSQAALESDHEAKQARLDAVYREIGRYSDLIGAKDLGALNQRAGFTNALLDRICAFFYEYHYRLFQSAKGMIDVAQVTDDLGSQTGPLISLDIFRTFYKPRMQRFIDLCHSFNIKVFHHDDGSCRQFLPDLVTMGIDILNPIQHNCPGMDMLQLKREFGRKLCFHGAIDNQQILPFGTPQQVRKEVRDAIDALASDRTGYILAPCHNIQAVSPVENIIAMYDEAWNYGKLR